MLPSLLLNTDLYERLESLRTNGKPFCHSSKVSCLLRSEVSSPLAVLAPRLTGVGASGGPRAAKEDDRELRVGVGPSSGGRPPLEPGVGGPMRGLMPIDWPNMAGFK